MANKQESYNEPYVLAVVLKHKEIKNNPKRISKIKPFIPQYEWKEEKKLLLGKK